MTDKRIWQGMCGCWHVGTPRKWPWFCKPEWYWGRWSPVWVGGDEYCRYTLVIGWNFTGQIVIPLRYCRGECEDGEGCADYIFAGSNWAMYPKIGMSLGMHRSASRVMLEEYEKILAEIDAEANL